MHERLIHIAEDAHIAFNRGDFFGKEIKQQGCSVLVNDELPGDPYLNYATKLQIAGDPEPVLADVESLFRTHHAAPSFYLLPYSRPKNLETVLRRRGYQLFTKDVWMFFDLTKKPLQSKATPITVRSITAQELHAFKRVFNEVYMKGEKDDPYTNLSHWYGEFVERRFLRKEKSGETSYVAAFIGDAMVGTISLEHDRKNGGIYSFAVLPAYRRQGVGTALLGHCIALAQELRLKRLFLQTKKDSRNEKIFAKLGFTTLFTGRQWYKPVRQKRIA